MLMAHPVLLRNLVEQYRTLSLLHAEDATTDVRQKLEDVSYTLCVSTGTRTPEAALIAARDRLVDAFGGEDPLLVA
ncbi:DUF5133 domain-containing protein [Streptomyces solincola]|uniref:DUF5133 domain-containing protein n=1 Tax=Streptomyces solincola TaxID=2100817 RepID=A0A2S9PZH7_9ACTN|nr:DUF5133 domain-containing protein [Streptomyces solincola]PRH79830.1 DUF5133 domain-containing protein [Streptomyces solincola]